MNMIASIDDVIEKSLLHFGRQVFSLDKKNLGPEIQDYLDGIKKGFKSGILPYFFAHEDLVPIMTFVNNGDEFYHEYICPVSNNIDSLIGKYSKLLQPESGSELRAFFLGGCEYKNSRFANNLVTCLGIMEGQKTMIMCLISDLRKFKDLR